MRNSHCSDAANESIYHLGFVGLDGNGQPVFPATAPYTGAYPSFLGQNYNAIFGVGGNGQYNLNQSLCQAFRMTSYALRILPAIETVTDTTQPYVSFYTAGSLSANVLEQWMNGNSIDIRTTLKNSFGSEVYGNNEGATVRLDPTQVKDFYEMMPLQRWGSDNYRQDYLKIPVIAMTFSEAIDFGETLPFITHCQWWMEAQLMLPTPIYASPSPVDPDFDKVLAMLSTCRDIYPIVTKGHSFPTFISQLPAFLRAANRILRLSSSIVHTGARSFRRGTRRIRKRQGPGRRRKRKNRKARANRTGRIGRAVPSSIVRPVKNQ
jgi:hypothetical protein